MSLAIKAQQCWQQIFGPYKQLTGQIVSPCCHTVGAPAARCSIMQPSSNRATNQRVSSLRLRPQSNLVQYIADIRCQKQRMVTDTSNVPQLLMQPASCCWSRKCSTYVNCNWKRVEVAVVAADCCTTHIDSCGKYCVNVANYMSLTFIEEKSFCGHYEHTYLHVACWCTGRVINFLRVCGK